MVRKTFVFIILLAAIFCVRAKWGLATEIRVTSTDYEYPVQADGDCSITEAFLAAGEDRAVDACPAGQAAPNQNVIHLQENATYTLPRPYGEGAVTEGLPRVYGNTVIEGHGAIIERRADAPNFRLLYSSGTLVIRNLTLTGGNLPGDNGGAIYFFGNLTIEESTLRNNSARMGGAIFSRNTVNAYTQTLASLTLNRVTVSQNTATMNGGAFFLEGDGTINDSTLTDNSVNDPQNLGQGGALFHKFGIEALYIGNTWKPSIQSTLRVSRSVLSNNRANFGSAIWNMGPQGAYPGEPRRASGLLLMSMDTVSGNTALGGGGAIYNNGQARIYNSSILSNNGGAIRNEGITPRPNLLGVGAYFLLLNSTIANNTKPRFGGGIQSGRIDSGLILNSTISGNTTSDDATDGIYVGSAALRIMNSILAGNGNGECGGDVALYSLGNNIIGNAGPCNLQQANGDRVGVQPGLAALTGLDDSIAGNERFPLNDDSPAIDNGNPAVCVNTAKTPNLDKDQVGRSREGPCDSGSSEAISVVQRWTFDEDQGSTVVDQSGNGKDGQLFGDNGLPTRVAGTSANGVHCDGVDDFIQTPQPTAIGVANIWSLSFWVKLESLGSQPLAVVGKKSGQRGVNAKNYVQMNFQDDGKINIWYFGDDRTFKSLTTNNPTTLKAGEWKHIALTKSQENTLAGFVLYVNGVPVTLVGDANYTAQVDDAERLVTFCREPDSNFRSQASFDEWVLRKKALSAPQVVAECQRTAPAGLTCGQ